MATVTWRRVVAALVATMLGLGALVVVFRSDGLPAVDAVASRATRWFVHQSTGRVVLADGYGGRALASLNVDSQGGDLRVAEGRSGAYVINDATGEVRAIDAAELRLGPAQGLATLGAGEAVAGVGSSGLVIVNAEQGNATLLPASGESVGFEIDVGPETLVAPDGSIWTIVDGDLIRTSSAGSTDTALAVGDASTLQLSLVGNRPLLLDRPNRRVRLGDGDWQALPTQVAPSEIIAQQPGPANSCGWVGGNDDLWCVSESGIEEDVTIEDLDIDGSDFLAIAGDAAALVRRGPTSITRFDWRDEAIVQNRDTSVSGSAILSVVATVDLVWVDDVDGETVWAINPWDVRAIDKNDGTTLVFGDDGEIISEGGDGSGSGGDGAGGEGVGSGNDEREPDNNGFDDPPVAIDDPVTARAGRPVSVPVTANDYDPDGEAIAVVAVGLAGHGTVEIGSASTVVYTPEPGYVGLDQFSYTIADGNGTEASADVIVELVPLDATNQPPIGSPDEAETGPGVPVVVDVLLNDVDPDRDPIRIGSFTVPEGLGEVTETVGPAGLAALRFVPLSGFEGSAVFGYRPVDSFGAIGESVEVRVEVASEGDANRPPIVRPDSVRLRRGVKGFLPVLVNDEDPDGDLLTLSVVEPVPEGLSVQAEGDQLAITARAGSAESIPFEYAVDDGNGHVVTGAVLVDVIDDVEPNRPPLVVADSESAVVGRTIEIDVLANDSDPDGDPLVVVDVTQPDGDRGEAVVLAPNRVRFTAAPLDDEEDAIARLTYTVDDGNRHQVTGDITITVLPEPLPEPPYAQDDSTFTFVDEPVTIDVLRNDGDPSGERPRLVGRPGCPGGGSALVTVDSQVRFDPPRGESGAFRCTYEVTNSVGLRASASIIVSVREPLTTNEPPVAALDRVILEIEETVVIDVTENDDDPDGDDDELVVLSSTAPSLGSATRDGNTITFTAGAITGVTVINYQVADVEGAVSLGQVSIRINEKTNSRPIASPDFRSIPGPGVPTTFDVLDNDVDPDEPSSALSVASLDLVSGDGSPSRSGRLVTITPDPDFVGDIVVSYVVSDSEGATDTALITLEVREPENRSPVAVDDTNDVNNGGSVSTAVLFNDSDPDGDALELSIVGGPDPALGSARIDNSSIVFDAQSGADGVAVITYSISDGELSDEAVLRITVRPCSASAPTAQDAFLFTGYQQPIAIDLNDYATNGTISNVSGPSGFVGGTYTPPAGENGNVVIRFSVENTCGQRADGKITIDVNRDPVAQPVAISLGRGEVREFPVVNLAGDHEPLVISASSGEPNWVTTEASRVVVAPPPGTAVGTSVWTVTVTDPGGLTAIVDFSVTIANAAPIANGDTVDVSGGPASFPIVDNDTDPDGGEGALRIQSVPAVITFENGETGTVTVDGPHQRSVLIDPLNGRGDASFTYTIVDNDGVVSAAATVVVFGPPLNSPPMASDQSVDVEPGVPTTFVLTASDPDGDTVSVVNRVDPSAIVNLVSGLSVTVIAPSEGTFTFTYQAFDGRELSPVATVTVVAATISTTTTSTTVPATTTTTVPVTTTTTTVPTTTTTTTVPTTTTTTTSTTTTTTTSTTTTTVAPTTTTTQPAVDQD